MKRDQPGTTRAFIRNGLILWVIVLVIFILLKLLAGNVGDLEIENDQTGFLEQLGAIIFLFGVCGIPVMLALSILLKAVEKGIDRIGKKKEEKNKLTP